MMHLKYLSVLVLCILLAGLAGCDKKIVVTQYPEFWSEELGIDAVAVVAFRNQSDTRGAGEIVSDKLAAALGANGTYKTYNRNDLRSVMDEQDLQIAMGEDASAAARRTQKFSQVQAMITGTVTSYKAGTKVEQRQQSQPLYAYDAAGNRLTDQFGQPVVRGYNNVPYQFTRHDAVSECTASLIRIKDGAVIASVSENGSWWSEGPTPPLDANGCMVNACSEMVGKMVERLAIVRKQITVGSDALQTASEKYDGKWEKQGKFPVSAGRLFVVVKLPVEADRNRFRIVIVRKDMRSELAGQGIVWDKQFAQVGNGWAFSPAELAAKGGGAGKYTAKLYSGEEPVLTRDFALTAK